jgi:tRNA/tmRNA/rRNA uracil-C5-methylase (TrmA/RlmC/RlmD family)
MSNLEEAYKRDLEKKTLFMEAILREAGLSQINIPIVPTPVQDGYRSRVKFKIFRRGKDAAVYGTDPVQGEVPLKRVLWLLPEWGQEVARKVTQVLLPQHSVYEVDGFEIQLTHGRELAHVTLSVKKTRKDPYLTLASALLEHVPGLVGVAVPSQKMDAGELFLSHRILDLEVRAHHAAFFQSNLLLLPELLNTVEGWLDGRDCRDIKDLYCGVGLFTLFAGTEHSHILGVDSSRYAVESARKNAAAFGFSRSAYICSSVEKFVNEVEFGVEDLIFIDPPRSGCPSSVISAVAGRRPRNIYLVSCSFDSHVRDLKQWQEQGYRVVSLAAFDMFPFTEFLETVTLLDRKR